MPDQLEELSEQGLRSANQYQRRIIADGDEQALAQFLHPNFTINGPNNICGGREQILRLSKGDALAQENCRTHIERTSLTGNVGIVMGNEMVTPADGSLLAGWFGMKPLRRRFMDVYVFEDGRWMFLARQGSVVREVQKFAG